MQQKFFVLLVLKQRESKSNRHAPAACFFILFQQRHALIFKADTDSIADGALHRAFAYAELRPAFHLLSEERQAAHAYTAPRGYQATRFFEALGKVRQSTPLQC